MEGKAFFYYWIVRESSMKVMESSEKFQEILFSDVGCNPHVMWIFCGMKPKATSIFSTILFFDLVKIIVLFSRSYLVNCRVIAFLIWIEYIVNSCRYNINCFFVLQINLFVVTSRASNSILPSFIFFMNPDILRSYLH